jgi:glucokinase
MDGRPAEPLTPEAMTKRARDGSCPVCAAAIEMFCAMLGTAASDLALTLGARGGIYIAGGIVPKLGDLFIRSGFRQRFETKGRFSAYMAAIPTYVIMREIPAFLGLAVLLDQDRNL